MSRSIERREFLAARAAALPYLAAAGAGPLMPSPSLAVDAPARRLGTCGPPPRKNAQRQTAAEGIPPLPLPVTPLRRSEPKAEPTPPIMIAKLEYGTTQDWNTDPGDVDNLLRHCREGLGLWYGWKQLNLNDVVAQHQAGKRTRVPLLYISGHEAFEFTPDQRAALTKYLFDGGTLLGDACCGRVEFAESFRREVEAILPNRSFDLLQIDHPVFRAFYRYATVHYRTFQGAVKNEFEATPEIYGANIGTRAGVLFTPYDMSCGWDEHTHDHGARLIPGDAIRLGLNIVSYVAAMRQVGEVEAVTREIHAPAERPRQQFTLAQLKHHGDWNPDPNSTYQWLRRLSDESSLAVSFDLKYVEPREGQIAPYPFLYLTGFRNPRLTGDEVTALGRHLRAGGFLFINNTSGYHEFDQHARSLARRMFDDQELTRVPDDHPLFDSLFKIEQVRDRQSGAPRAAELEAIGIRDRLVLVYSKNDAVSQLKQVSDPYGNGYDAESCRQLLLNIVAYAMQS
jgi:hypothetical protein